MEASTVLAGKQAVLMGNGAADGGGVLRGGGFVENAIATAHLATGGGSPSVPSSTTSTTSGSASTLTSVSSSSSSSALANEAAQTVDVAGDSDEDVDQVNVKEDEQGKQWTLRETKKLLEAVKKYGRYSYEKLNEELKSHQLRPNDGIAQTRNRLKVVFGKKSPFKQPYKHKLFRLPKGVPGKSLTREQKIEMETKHSNEQQHNSRIHEKIRGLLKEIDDSDLLVASRSIKNPSSEDELSHLAAKRPRRESQPISPQHQGASNEKYLRLKALGLREQEVYESRIQLMEQFSSLLKQMLENDAESLRIKKEIVELKKQKRDREEAHLNNGNSELDFETNEFTDTINHAALASSTTTTATNTGTTATSSADNGSDEVEEVDVEMSWDANDTSRGPTKRRRQGGDDEDEQQQQGEDDSVAAIEEDEDGVLTNSSLLKRTRRTSGSSASNTKT